MSSICAVEFEPTEAILQIACICEGERFRNLDDQAALDELNVLRVYLCVFKPVLSPRYFAQDLDAGFGGVTDNLEDGETNAEGNSEIKGVEYRGEEYEEHQG